MADCLRKSVVDNAKLSKTKYCVESGPDDSDEDDVVMRPWQWEWGKWLCQSDWISCCDKGVEKLAHGGMLLIKYSYWNEVVL